MDYLETKAIFSYCNKVFMMCYEWLEFEFTTFTEFLSIVGSIVLFDHERFDSFNVWWCWVI